MTTISKVAERAGVSRTTVSHVLNHADRVSEHLRERVLKAVNELGYVPNPHAKSLRTGRTNIVAMLIPDIRNPFYTELVKTAQYELDRVGRDVLVFNADVPGGHPQEHSREYLAQIRSKGVDGLIVGDFALHGMYDAILGVDIPTVFIGNLPNKAVDSVRADDHGGSYAMGAYFAERGHKRVFQVTGPSYFAPAVMRAEGFEKGLADNGVGMPGEMRFEGTYLSPSGKQAIDWLVEHHRDNLPTAIFFANYLMALGGLAALYDHGLRVPDDIAVSVFGDQSPMEYVRPLLTRVGVPPSTLAAKACRMLIERLEGTYIDAPRAEIVECALLAMNSA